MRNFWLNAFIEPNKYPTTYVWNAQVMDYMSSDEVNFVKCNMKTGKEEEDLVVTFLLSEQLCDFDPDKLIKDLENAWDAVFDVVNEDEEAIEMYSIYILKSKASYDTTAKGVEVTWRFKHRCFFKYVW